MNEFRDKYKSMQGLRVLVHVPSREISPAGYSVFSNLIDSLQFIGISSAPLAWDEAIEPQLQSFLPTVFLTSDSTDYLDRIDWNALARYRAGRALRVGLTASIEAYGNSPLEGRLKWAKAHGVDFYYSFRAPEYLQARKDYAPFFAEGYKIFSIEFGANPLLYYPVDGIECDIPFVFLGSSNADKHQRYLDWFGRIFTRYGGFINGPGWQGMNSLIPMDVNRYIFARAQVGVNLHLQGQVDWPCELNERTYMLAACGVPQLIDNPALLSKRFSSKAMFAAADPGTYADLFEHMLKHPDEADAAALQAMEEVFKKHTTFHRAEGFVKALQKREN